MTNSAPIQVLGSSLRGQVYDLLRLATKLDGLQPFLIVASVGSPVIVWLENEPTVEQAAKFIPAGTVVSVLPCDLRGLSGSVPWNSIGGHG